MHPEIRIDWRHWLAALAAAIALHAALLLLLGPPGIAPLPGAAADGLARGTGPLRLSLGPSRGPEPGAALESRARAHAQPPPAAEPTPVPRVDPTPPAIRPSPRPAVAAAPLPAVAAAAPSADSDPRDGSTGGRGDPAENDVGGGAAETAGGLASGDAGGRGGEDAGAGRADYWSALHARVNRARRYPRRAKRNGVEGTVLLSVAIDRVGNVRTLEIARSSGSAALDRAAVGTVQRAAPFGSVPPGSRESDLTFELPIEFTLSDRTPRDGEETMR